MKLHINTLCDPGFEGRGFGTAGSKKAGKYISDYFKLNGMSSLTNDGSFFQPFSRMICFDSRQRESGSVEIVVSNRKKNISIANNDLCIYQSRGIINLNGDLVFAGYGIVTEDYND